MTDRDVLIVMLTRAGIPFHEAPYDGSVHLPAVTTIMVYANEPMTGLPEGAHDHRRHTLGYTGFYTDFYFDAAGALLNLGAYE